MRSFTRGSLAALKSMAILTIGIACSACMAPAQAQFSAPILIDEGFVEPEILKPESIDSDLASSLLQIDLLNELVMGQKLKPKVAACMDGEDRRHDHLKEHRPKNERATAKESSARSEERGKKHRAYLDCLNPNDGDIRYHSTNSIRRTFSVHLQARLALEETKDHARNCLKKRILKTDDEEDAFKRCLELNPILTSQSASRGWLSLFERYTESR